MFILILVAAYFGAVLYGGLSITDVLTRPLKSSVCCLDIPHEDIHFKTTDGLTLSGWYVPPKNGAVIILLHAYFGNRGWVAPTAQMLTRHGFGVLMYDQRGSGESQGEMRSFGWRDIPDAGAAVSWVQSRSGADQPRIGIYGCSMGGAIALGAAAQNPAITAIAADAPTPIGFNEGMPGFDDPIWGFKLPVYVIYYSVIGLRSQTTPPISTTQAVQAVAPRPLLLISSGATGERQRVDALYQVAQSPKFNWNIPSAGHCGGPSVRPAEYERHLTDFFTGALLK